jgi:hypothetical protein
MEKMYQVIPEKIIKNCAMELENEEPNNSFKSLLEEGKIYKQASLTPMYILNVETREMMVTSREKMSEKCH